MNCSPHSRYGLRLQRTRKIFAFLTLAFLCVVGTALSGGGIVPAETAQSTVPSDAQRLEGLWIRPDGGYMLALRDIRKDGGLKAAYSNPRPIKVFHAKWSRKEGNLHVFVELRDVNYPGSKYHVQYDPASDRLRGTYFQAVEQQTYAVEFVRSR